jgi:hypothetical protein
MEWLPEVERVCRDGVGCEFRGWDVLEKGRKQLKKSEIGKCVSSIRYIYEHSPGNRRNSSQFFQRDLNIMMAPPAAAERNATHDTRYRR